MAATLPLERSADEAPGLAPVSSPAAPTVQEETVGPARLTIVHGPQARGWPSQEEASQGVLPAPLLVGAANAPGPTPRIAHPGHHTRHSTAPPTEPPLGAFRAAIAVPQPVIARAGRFPTAVPEAVAIAPLDGVVDAREQGVPTPGAALGAVAVRVVVAEPIRRGGPAAKGVAPLVAARAWVVTTRPLDRTHSTNGPTVVGRATTSGTTGGAGGPTTQSGRARSTASTGRCKGWSGRSSRPFTRPFPTSSRVPRRTAHGAARSSGRNGITNTTGGGGKNRASRRSGTDDGGTLRSRRTSGSSTPSASTPNRAGSYSCAPTGGSSTGGPSHAGTSHGTSASPPAAQTPGGTDGSRGSGARGSHSGGRRPTTSNTA